MQSGNKNIQPDSVSFSTCLNIWAKNKENAKDSIREAMDLYKKNLDSIIASAGENASENGNEIGSNAIAEMEEIAKRIRHNAKGGINNVKQQTSPQPHEKLVKACTPFISS